VIGSVTLLILAVLGLVLAHAALKHRVDIEFEATPSQGLRFKLAHVATLDASIQESTGNGGVDSLPQGSQHDPVQTEVSAQ
jgi:hypothetical protein